ncbi:MAG: hypothetical protein GWM88_18195 [Pseudomonadales bacterium]|nr:hypothetical protein [Pseudomonadales bacterium]NIX09858.1 hypothetical protein [Pseudomonadales bacterium]
MTERAGSFFPGQLDSTLYAMAGDDCSLHFDLNTLTAKQLADHLSNIELTAMLQVALLYIGKPVDHVAMFDAFQRSPWRETLDFYRRAFATMGVPPVPESNCHYYPQGGFYEAVAADRVDTDLTTLYLVSGSNAVVHRSEAALAVSQRVNSKMQLAADAAQWDIPVPETLICRKRDLGSESVAGFFDAHDDQVMLKLKGLAGARNVTSVAGVAECVDYVAEYPDDMEIVLQRKLNADEFTEMTVDLIVRDDSIEIANVRRILFADGLWVGNLIGGDVAVDPAHESALIRIGEYVRDLGYSSPEGFNCGIDYFVSADELLITEINARWTGGLFPAEMIRRLDLSDQGSVAFFDVVSRDGLDSYRSFSEDTLYPRRDGPFASVPLGFSPFPMPVEGRDMHPVWQMVVGDIEAFKAAKRAALAPGDLPTADKISLSF